jgi:glutaredoxin 3
MTTPSGVTIYSKDACPFCIKAKDFLASHGIDYCEVRMDPSDPNYPGQRDKLVAETNHRTFPFIFFGSTFVGGYSDLLDAYESTRLHEICKGLGISLEYDF